MDDFNMPEKMEVLNRIDCSPNPFVVKRIVNIHLSKKERKKVIREAMFFALTGFALLGGIYGTMISFDYKMVLAFYLIIFINLPVLLLPAILIRKDLI